MGAFQEIQTMKILATLLFPMLALAGVTYFMILPAVQVVGNISALIAGVK